MTVQWFQIIVLCLLSVAGGYGVGRMAGYRHEKGTLDMLAERFPEEMNCICPIDWDDRCPVHGGV